MHRATCTTPPLSTPSGPTVGQVCDASESMSTPPATAANRDVGDLTQAVFGERFSMAEVLAHLDAMPASGRGDGAVWLGSVGYENHRDSSEFAAFLADAGVERIIDVRELPLSRRRGYSKTALSKTLGEAGIEYLHMRALGNPKELRDIYKSGRPEEGRRLYSAFLAEHRQEAVRGLAAMLAEKRTALMCLEGDPAVCHRTVIIEALEALGDVSVARDELAE